jgi:hypothetical protein
MCWPKDQNSWSGEELVFVFKRNLIETPYTDRAKKALKIDLLKY